jgi:NAD-dependent deacetylase
VGDLEALKRRLSVARNVVLLTGAGISVASGLRTYRGPGGLWTSDPNLAQELKAGVDAAKLWSTTCAWRREIALAEPNAAHVAMARFEERLAHDGRSCIVITQNIDGLHQKAGSKHVIDLHGSIERSRCSNTKCTTEPFIDRRSEGEVPTCPSCGAPIRPDIVLFDEPLGALEEVSAKRALRDVDLFVAIGTSGTVSPASNFVRAAEYSGAHTVLLNLEIGSSSFAECHQGDAVTLVPSLFR